MPGNKTVFQYAIAKGHNAAWDGQWTKAIAEYRRAIVEFPQDVTAHLSLAHALEESKQYEDALHESRIAAKLQPHDPLPMVYVAKLQERLQRHAEAAATWLNVAEMYTAQKAVGKAVEAWQKATALEPERTDVHERLAQVYEQGGHVSLAAKEQLTLARLYQKRADAVRAIASAERAVSLDAHNKTAQALLDELMQARTPAAPAPAGPVSQAKRTALARLAESLLGEKPGRSDTGANGSAASTLSDAAVNALVARAVDAQSQHRVPDAVDAYRQLLDAGVSHAEVKFNLGLLYLETMRYDDAVRLLRQTVADPNYALASHFALGQCYRAQGNADAAVEHFLHVTKIVDLASVQREQADELISVYEGLAESYVAKGDTARAETYSRTLEDLLTSKGWQDKVREVRHHLDLLREQGRDASLAEIVNLPDSDKVLESLALSKEYLRRGKFQAAGEECYRAIELAPNYLPAHTRLAEVLAKEGRVDEARLKYQTLAELAEARGDLGRAEGFYRQLLKLAPDDIGHRSRLIDLLGKQGRVQDALDEYLELGAGLMRAGQLDKAAEIFSEGARVASSKGIASPAAMNLGRRRAEAQARQGDLRGALATYQELNQKAPEDERTHVYLVDLEFRLGESAAALRDLEELIARYRTRNEPKKAIAVLEGLISSHPGETAPRAWLAQICINTGDREKAIAALDGLGEMQLSAGQDQAAAATIRQIIALNPPRIEEYRQLLQQISG